MAEPIDAAADVADSAQPDPLEMLMRKDAVKTAVSRFVELPTLQRSVVILKDVLDDPKYDEGFAFGLKGDTGVTMLEAAA